MRSHVFVGRQAAFSFLRERHYRASCGDGGAVFLSGEAGIGKTRLCTEFCESIAAGDPNVIVTRSVDYASSPFAPIVETVERWSQKRAHLFDAQVGLREACSTIVRADVEGRSPTAGERRRCFDGIARLFRIASSDAPTTLVIDDLHEADPATLQLLSHILGATRRSAFLLLATVRPIELVAAERRSDLTRLLRAEAAEVYPLTDLAPAEMNALVLDAADGRLERATRSALVKRAAGNPLFAEELVRQALAAPAAAEIVPMSVADIVVDRLERLGSRERSLLTFAAVIGVEFSGTFLATVTESAQAFVYAAVRAATVLGLVEETDAADVFRFRHALMCDAVYAQPLEIERRVMHRQVFEAMRHSPHEWSIGAIAHHAAAAKDLAATAYYGELAGDHAAANRAAESACLYYEAALTACGPDAVARLNQKLAHARLAAGFPNLAEAPGRRLLRERLDSRDTAGALEAFLLLAEAAAASGADDTRLSIFGEMREFLANVPEPLWNPYRALSDVELAYAENDMERVISVSGGSEVRTVPDVRVAIAISNARAHALLVQRQYRRAIAAQTLAVRRAVHERDSELETATRINLGVVSFMSGELGRAANAFGTASAIARRRVATTDRAMSLAMEADCQLVRGNVEESRRLLAESVAEAEHSDHPAILIFAGRTGIWIGQRQSDPAFGRHVVEALDIERAMFGRGADRLHPLAGAFAHHLISLGREAEAHAILRRAIAFLQLDKRFRLTDWSVCSMLMVAEVGHPDDVPLARQPLAASCAPFSSAFVNLFDATVAQRRGDREAARRFAEHAVEPLVKYNFAFEASSALGLAGRVPEALELARRHDFTVLVRRFSDELRVKNRQGRATTELTKREREVARLIEESLSNRAIADRLSVSEKTVETHLAAIFAKLQVRSRVEVGPALLRANGETGAVTH